MYTCMLNQRGGVESDLTVSRISPGAPASPLAPTFEGKSPEQGDAECGCVSAPLWDRCLGLRACSSAPSLPQRPLQSQQLWWQAQSRISSISATLRVITFA